MRVARDMAWLVAAAAAASLTSAALFMLLLATDGLPMQSLAGFGVAALQAAAWLAFLTGLPLLIGLYFTRRLTLPAITTAGAVVGLAAPLLLSAWDPLTVSFCIVLGALSALAAYPVAVRSNKTRSRRGETQAGFDV
jgi:hypothetical protein